MLNIMAANVGQVVGCNTARYASRTCLVQALVVFYQHAATIVLWPLSAAHGCAVTAASQQASTPMFGVPIAVVHWGLRAS